jgi:hypothetical protein
MLKNGFFFSKFRKEHNNFETTKLGGIKRNWLVARKCKGGG